MPAIVNREECVSCGTCAEECLEEAVTLDDEEIAVVDSKICTECGTCVEACPSEALSIGGEKPSLQEISISLSLHLNSAIRYRGMKVLYTEWPYHTMVAF